MQTTLESTDKHTVKLTVEVEPERFGRDLERAYRKVAEQVRIPGFRKGKAPRPIIDAQVGRETVLQEFLEDAVPRYYREALREHELAPISQPDIDLQQLEEGKPFVFSATVEVRPRLHLTEADYKGIRVERPSVQVTEEEVDRLLDALRERFAELEPVARPAAAGDYVLVDLRATIHGEEVPEATRPDFLYEVGAGEFTGKLDEELQGARAGDILKFNATLDDRFGERAGKEVAFQVLVKEVKAKRLPAADDDFARTASEFDTLEELRAALREQLEANKRRAVEEEVRDRVLRALVERTEVDLPETLVQEEVEHRLTHARERAEQLGLTLERLLELQGMDELRFRAEAREHAERAIVADLVLEAVARAEDLQVTAEELAREVERLARALGREPKEVATSLERTGQIVTLAGDIIRSKALDVLVQHAEIVPEDGAAPGGDASGAPTEPPVGDVPPADNPEEEP